MKHHTKTNTQEQNKWITFIYFRHRTKQITKIFKDISTKITLKSINTIQNIYNKSSKYDSSRVYKLKCSDCPIQYIGKKDDHSKLDTTNIHMQGAIKRHIHCAQHIPNTGYPYESIQNTMEIMLIARKSKQINSLENFLYLLYMLTKEAKC
jgi:hypothetical protein